MGKMEEEPDSKSQLVIDICSISTKSTSCMHRRHHPGKPAFIDWYLLLQVDEDAGIEVIRRRYRQLALLLHPDKNRHPKAGVAFKLVSEACECLSDKSKRGAFNYERKNSFCKECNKKWHQPKVLDMGKPKRGNPTEQERSYRAVVQAMEEVRNRFKEEAEVIDNCLRAHAAASKEDYPLFDPSGYVMFSNYPHQRTQILRKPIPKEFWDMGVGNGVATSVYSRRKRSCESPVYRPIGAEVFLGPHVGEERGGQCRRRERWPAREVLNE